MEARSPTFNDKIVEWKGFILGGTVRQNHFYISILRVVLRVFPELISCKPF